MTDKEFLNVEIANLESILTNCEKDYSKKELIEMENKLQILRKDMEIYDKYDCKNMRFVTISFLLNNMNYIKEFYCINEEKVFDLMQNLCNIEKNCKFTAKIQTLTINNGIFNPMHYIDSYSGECFENSTTFKKL